MLFINNILDTNIYLFIYMSLYNISLVSFFWSIFSFTTLKLKTLYSLSEFTQNSFIVLNLSILLFSMAGVPPFIGFFSKIFIMFLVLNNNYFIFYAIFFILLFLGLYFYIQNIRFLHSTNYKNHYNPSILNERVSVPTLYIILTILMSIIFGLVYIDDFILFITWLFY